MARNSSRPLSDVAHKPDSALFTTDLDHDAIKKVRLTLRQKEERRKIKEEARTHSRTEGLLVKRKMQALLNRKPDKSKRSEDVWDEEEAPITRKKKKFIEFAKTKECLLPAIVKPHPG